jgi:predicted nucleic acid-binding protein
LETKVVLDTSLIFDFFVNASYADPVEKLLRAKYAVVSAITVLELFNGVMIKKHLDDRKRLVNLCDVYSLTLEIAMEASHLYTNLKGSGKTRPLVTSNSRVTCPNRRIKTW